MAYTTRISVLRGAADGNEIYWKTFYDTYRPLIMLVGGDCNLKPDEKEELVQNVMCEVFQKDILGKFDPDNVPEHVTYKHDESKGRFRSYFRKIVRYQAIKIFHKRSNALSIDADNKPVSLISEDEFDAIWNDVESNKTDLADFHQQVNNFISEVHTSHIEIKNSIKNLESANKASHIIYEKRIKTAYYVGGTALGLSIINYILQVLGVFEL